MALCTCRRSLLRRMVDPAGRLRDLLWPSPCLRRLGIRRRSLRSLNRAFTRRCGPRTRSPCQAGLCRWAPPEGISPSGAIQAMRLRPLAASGLSPYGSMGTSRHHANIEPRRRVIESRSGSGAGSREVERQTLSPAVASPSPGAGAGRQPGSRAANIEPRRRAIDSRSGSGQAAGRSSGKH
jgi:hypothetical protein